jgi:branched-chain amino acid transport system substrate-binding protein
MVDHPLRQQIHLNRLSQKPGPPQTDEPLAVVAKMRATPVNDMFATGGYLREDGRMVHDMYLTEIKTPAESTGPWDLVKIVKIVRGEDVFRPLADSECPLVKR